MAAFDYAMSVFVSDISAKARKGHKGGLYTQPSAAQSNTCDSPKKRRRKGAKRQTTRKAAIFIDRSPYCLLFII